MERWLVLQQKDNPSTDYYIRPFLRSTGLPVVYKDLDTDHPQFGDLAPGTGVVIVRYMNTRWAKALRQHRAQLSEVAYFMDDDLLHPEHWAGLPNVYIKKLNKYCAAFAPDIQALASVYWFSTEELRARYPYQAAQVIAPRPLPEDAETQELWHPQSPKGPVQIFYHGSATHQAEMDWLYPVMREVLNARPRAHFELIGSHGVNQQFRNLPRTRVLHPLSWQNYVSHCRTLNAHIGLAPLLPSPFNMGRSHSKIFDITRCGAVGIYSDPSTYATAIEDREDGLLLANDPDLWVEEIIGLIDDSARLNTLRQRAIERHSTSQPELDASGHREAGLVLQP
ncbi:glycosyltransferase family 4 protein [Bordetella sp. 15P40C-2]|uniref:glycosyltransferase family 4 protein n=1 Tax=Bordetella sp. 15P40C-2 TaxID=2572246 RepID=UPI001320B2A0|nr:hypothetical protein [Bordetella sp. 15P40C-2]